MASGSPAPAKGGQGIVALTFADPNLKDHLKLDTFKGKFSVRDFVELVTAKLLTLQPSPNDFDPKPYIRNFEAVNDELNKLKRKVQNKIEDLEDAARASDEGRKRKTQELAAAFDDVESSFMALEGRLAEVGNTAIKIGEQLETIDKQRTRAVEAKDLIQHYIDFNAGNTSRLDEIMAGGPDGEYKAAIIARRLSVIAKDVDLPGTEKARASIESYCEALEKRLLDAFDAAYRENDKMVMKRYAKTLYDFNGGSSCVQMFVNQHEFFINSLKYSEEIASVERLKANQPDTQLSSLCQDIAKKTEQEWDVISVVFPNAVSVMQLFLQRVFAQSVQIQLESILTVAGGDSEYLYLCTLSSSHSVISKLLADLHRFDDTVIASYLSGRPSSAVSGSASSGNSGAPKMVAKQVGGLSNVLDRSFDDLLVPYTEADRYIAVEKRCLTNKLDEHLQPFYQHMESRQKPIAGARKGATGARTPATGPTNSPNLKTSNPALSSAAGTSPTKDAAQLFQKALNDLAAVGAAALASAPGLSPTSPRIDESGGIPSVEIVLKLLSEHSEASGRCRELSAPSESAKNAGALFTLLINTVGNKYLEVALDLVMEDLVLNDGKAEPDVSHLSFIQLSTEILQLCQIHFQNAVLQLVGTSPTIHREMVMLKNEFIAAVEARLNTLLQKHIDAVVSWLVVLLSKQKKLDFKPKDETSEQPSTTQPCSQICEFLRKVHGTTSKILRGEGQSVFFSEVWLAFHGMMLEHLKKFSVSHAGGLILAKDLAYYQQTIALFQQPTLNERFEMLREIGTLFVVKPENLRTLLNQGSSDKSNGTANSRGGAKSAKSEVGVGDSYLSKVDVELLYPYLSMRADWAKVSKSNLASQPAAPHVQQDELQRAQRKIHLSVEYMTVEAKTSTTPTMNV
ncbi:exocyst complex component Sec10-like protein [Cladochytrium replicatum]|nr:exocyst complex component Sec10-like protein [Cladochytrium replicatum]